LFGVVDFNCVPFANLELVLTTRPRDCLEDEFA
jgi:hypothetical protein